MNQDIAYNVLSFLENPRSYGRTSRSFQSGSIPAQREFTEYLRTHYPLILTSLEEILVRMSDDDLKQYEWRERVQRAVSQLFLFYLNKMVLNKQWELFWAAITLIDKDLLPSKIALMDMLHINGNDELAFRLYRIQDWPYKADMNIPYEFKNAVENYYRLYSQEVTDNRVWFYSTTQEGLGYVPDEVIEYLDKHPEQWRRESNFYGTNIIPSMMLRVPIGWTKMVKSQYQIPRDVLDPVITAVAKIARDYPNENIYQLITRIDPSLSHNKAILGVMMDEPWVYNREILQFIKDVMVELNEKPNIYTKPIILAYLRDMWINDEKLRKLIDNEVNKTETAEQPLYGLVRYIAIKQAEMLPIDEDGLIDLIRKSLMVLV